MKWSTLKPVTTVLSAMVLAALVAHVIVLRGLADPAEAYFWIDLEKEVSSYYLWSAPVYLGVVWLSLGLVAIGLLLNLLVPWWTRVARPARVVTLLGATVVISTQLLQPAFWTLGTGLSQWSWALPVRLSLLAVALGAGALLWSHHPTHHIATSHRFATWSLWGGLALLAALMLIPQPAQSHSPRALFLYCVVNKPQCDPPPRSCRGDLQLEAADFTIPLARLLGTIPVRAKAQARLADRMALHMDKTSTPKVWRSFAADSQFHGSGPWKEQFRQFRNAEVHLVSGQARLIGIGLVLGLGLLLFGWRLARRRSHAWRVGLHPRARALALALALAAGVAATGLMPEWSHASLLAHLPTTLLLALAVALASSTLLPDTERTAQRY